MPSDPRAALSSLLRAADIEDHEEVVKAANAAIQLDRNDLLAKHTKVVALLKLDHFDDALRLIDSHGESLQAACVVEKAYALYKAGKLDDATALLTLRTATQNAAGERGREERSLRHVAAQVAYRAERFDEAGEIYRQMLASEPAGEESDLKINAAAAAAQAHWKQAEGDFQSVSVGSVEETAETAETFEACYNLASGQIARGRLGHAANLLQRAAILCDNSDELDEEEKRAELRPIRAQQAFVLAKLGKHDEALQLYQSLAPFRETDGKDFEVVALNNLLALQPPGNPFLRQRNNESLLASLPAARLFAHQSSTLLSNALVIDLAAKKINGVRSRTGLILAQARHPTIAPAINAVSVLNAAAETDPCDDPADALRKLQSLAAKRPRDVGLALTIVQLQIKQNAPGSALSTLEGFLGRLEASEDAADRDARYGPGLVALAVSLLRSQQRESSAKKELTKAAQYWTARPETSASASASASVSSLLLAAGVQLMRSSSGDDLALAGASFERIFAQHRSAALSSAGLVASYAAIDGSKAAPHAAHLPPVEHLITGIDVPALIAGGVVTLGPVVVPSSVSKKRPAEGQADAAAQANANKHKRRRKLPKGYVEGKTPDPERWLPLRDRSTYRPKGRKAKKKADATQGGVVKEEEVLDLVGGGGVKVEKAGGAGKKKKKGKK